MDKFDGHIGFATWKPFFSKNLSIYILRLQNLMMFDFTKKLFVFIMIVYFLLKHCPMIKVINWCGFLLVMVFRLPNTTTTNPRLFFSTTLHHVCKKNYYQHGTPIFMPHFIICLVCPSSKDKSNGLWIDLT